MLAQRPPDAAPAVQASAEELPFDDDSFDAALAVLTMHHWCDWRAGVAEMRRVARRRIVVLTFDPAYIARYWLVRDYLPEIAVRTRRASRRSRPSPRRSAAPSRCRFRSRPTAATASCAPRGGARSPISTRPSARTSRACAVLRPDDGRCGARRGSSATSWTARWAERNADLLALGRGGLRLPLARRSIEG